MSARLYRPITDVEGNLRINSMVAFYAPGTTTLLTTPFFSDDALTQALPNPFDCANGIIDVYCASAQRMDIGVTPPGATEDIVHSIDTSELPLTLHYQTLVAPDGTPQPQRSKTKFVVSGGAAVSVVDDSTNDQTVITVSAPPPSGETLVFSLVGPVTAVASGLNTPRVSGILYEFRCLLKQAGSANTVVQVFINGTSVGTVTLGPGDTNIAVSLSVALTANVDIVHVECTTAGAGANTLTALARVAA